MNKFYCLLTILVCGAFGLQAQSTTIPEGLNSGSDGIPVSWIDAFIDADTAMNGSQNNDTYLLVPGGNYVFTANNTWGFDVTIASAGGPDDLRPFVGRARRDGAGNPGPIYTGTGNFTFDGIYLLLGDDGLDAAAYETASFRPAGDNKTYTFNNCIIEKSRQGTIRSEGENPTVIVTNNLLRNFGDYKRQQGNGRVVDIRTQFGDTVIIKNNVIHNILDRLYIGFRQQGLNYFEFSKNTVFNHVGRHGFIQLKNTKESVITDNFIQNPSIMGDFPFFANEQINLFNVAIPIFTLDTLLEGGSVTMLNNNIHWTDDVENHYATFDSVTKPVLFSPTFQAALTANGITREQAVFSEVLELANTPSRQPLIDYAREMILFKDSVGITDIMVQDSFEIDFLGRRADFPYNYNFENFSPCYDANAMSATAATDGGAVGAAGFCADLTSSTNNAFNPRIALTAFPNPANDVITFNYSLHQPGQVFLTIVDMKGALIERVLSGAQIGGQHSITYDRLGNLKPGMYIAAISTASGRMHVKFMKQ
jgi:hypothetical protein